MMLSDEKFEWIKNSKELKKAVVKRQQEVRANMYKCCQVLELDKRKMNLWLYLHTSHPSARSDFLTKNIISKVIELCDALAIRIHDKSNGYIIELRPLEYVTVPLFDKSINDGGDKNTRVAKAVR